MELKLSERELIQVKSKLSAAILALEDYNLYLLPLHKDAKEKLHEIVNDIYRLYVIIDRTNSTDYDKK